MTQIGYTMMGEQAGPNQLVRDVALPSRPASTSRSSANLNEHIVGGRWPLVGGRVPRTVTGKVQKFKMREASVAELGLESAAGTRTA
jgi:hypothetical protein